MPILIFFPRELLLVAFKDPFTCNFFSFLHTWALIWWDKKEKFLKAHPVISHCGNARISCQACYTNFIEKVWNIRNPNMPEIRQCVTFSLFEFTFFQFVDYITFCIGTLEKESVFLRGNPFFGPQRPFHERKKPLFFFKRLLLAKIGGPTFPKLVGLSWPIHKSILYNIH